MKKRTIIMITAVAAVFLLIGCSLWIYFGQKVPLTKYLPEGACETIRLTFSAPRDVKGYVVDDQAVKEIQKAIKEAKLRRTLSAEAWSSPVFELKLEHTLLYVSENGQVVISIRGDDYVSEKACYYFTGGEELYQQIREIAVKLKLFMTS